jgi:hypothetical protein
MIASAAAMAVSMPALAEKGGKGGGNGGGKPQAAQSQGGGNGAGKAQKPAGGGKPAKADNHVAHGGGGKPAKADRQVARGGGKPAKADRFDRQAFRGGGKPDKALKAEAKRQDGMARGRFEDRSAGGFLDGRNYAGNERGDCPPGLAGKNNGCLPPGQAKKVFGLGDRIQPAWFSGYTIPAAYQPLYADSGDYYFRYDNDGYIYRVDRDTNLISGLIPLLGGGFAVGQPLPTGYDVYNVPLQYRDVYQDSDDHLYRYGDNAIYQVDAQSGIIESIVALLAGDLNVGQALPSGYDAYNVPLDYRDEYADNEDYMYRYGDGSIYQVDTKTQIIQAIVEMLI